MFKRSLRLLSYQPATTTHHIPQPFFIPMAVDTLPMLHRAPRRQRRTLPAVWMRAGTSKGLFLHQRDLPSKREQWAPIILAAMGSNDSDPKQLNGVAGATSTTSKVAVVSPSRKPGVDVEYTFVQVSIGSPKLDFTGNCGNICSGVGPFAIDEGLVDVPLGARSVSCGLLHP
jgi:2-methylaconitate cis-trans-isomerase PrpF